MNFIIEAEGAILCFILYLIPGFPKDIISYLFGISPMPFWVFAVVSTVGPASPAPGSARTSARTSASSSTSTRCSSSRW